MTSYKTDTVGGGIGDEVPAVSFIDFAEEVLRPQSEELPKRKKRTKRPIASE